MAYDYCFYSVIISKSYGQCVKLKYQQNLIKFYRNIWKVSCFQRKFIQLACFQEWHKVLAKITRPFVLPGKAVQSARHLLCSLYWDDFLAWGLSGSFKWVRHTAIWISCISCFTRIILYTQMQLFLYFIANPPLYPWCQQRCCVF